MDRREFIAGSAVMVAAAVVPAAGSSAVASALVEIRVPRCFAVTSRALEKFAEEFVSLNELVLELPREGVVFYDNLRHEHVIRTTPAHIDRLGRDGLVWWDSHRLCFVGQT